MHKLFFELYVKIGSRHFNSTLVMVLNSFNFFFTNYLLPINLTALKGKL